MKRSRSGTIGRTTTALILWLGVAGSGAIAFAPAAAAAAKHGQAFQDWMIKCEGGEGVTERCVAFQNIVVTESRQQLLVLAAGYLGPKGEPWIVLTVPLGVLLQSGLALKVDEGERFDAAFKICTAKGCEAGIPLDDDLLPLMKAGLVARVAFMDGTARRQITVPVSLAGFSAAFRTLTAPDATGAVTPK